MTAKMGRPTRYTPELAKEICQRIGEGSSLVTVTKDMSVDYSCVMDWLHKYPDFTEMYAQARRSSADFKNDEISRVAYQTLTGEIDYNAARVFIDAMKWQAARQNPRKYGDKQQVEQTGNVGLTIQIKNYADIDNNKED